MSLMSSPHLYTWKTVIELNKKRWRRVVHLHFTRLESLWLLQTDRVSIWNGLPS